MARSTARNIYKLAFITFGLLTSTSLVNPARADSAVAQTDWAINRVASVASGSYCTMAQKYSDNTILTFAKNQTGEYSLAFDFVKPQFPNATATTVSLRPGNGAAQTFSVAPTSDKVIVIGLGANDSFLKAVKTSAKIDLETGGKVHSFTTSKFANAADELSGCTGSMKPAIASAKPQPATPATTSAPQTITASLSPASGEPAAPAIISNPNVKEVEKLTSDKADLINIQAENIQLKQALTEARQNYQAQQNNSQSAMTAELQEKLAGIQKENEALKSQKTISPDMAAELARTKADLAAIQAQNEKLQAQAAQTAQIQQASLATTQEISQLQKQNADMKAQLDAANQTVGTLQAKTAQSASEADQLAILQKQNADMKAQLDASTSSLSQLQLKSAEASASVAQLATLQKQNADMKVQLDAANNTVNQLQAKTIDSATAAQQVASLTKQAADMKAQLDAANKTVADLQSKNIQAASASDQLAILQKQNADMKVQLSAATTTIAQLQSKTSQSAAAADQVATLQKQLEASNQTIAQLQTKAAQTPSVDPNVLAQAQAAEKENAALKQQISSLQATLPAKSDADQQQLVALQGENAAIKSQLAALQNKPATAAVAPEVKTLQTKLDSAAQENAALKAQLASMQTPAAGGETGKSVATSSNWDLEQATKRYQESQREIQRLASKIQDQQKQFDKEKKDLQDKLFDPAVSDQAQRDKLNEMQQEIADLKTGKPATETQPNMVPVSPMAVPVTQVSKEPMQVSSIAPTAGDPSQGLGNVDDLPVPAIAMPMDVSAGKIAKSKPIINTAPTASAVISPVAKVNFQSKQDFEGMLKSAGINIQGPVEEVAGGNADSYRAYRWKTASLYGSVQQQAMKSAKAFDPAVDEYLARAKTRCSGDFAAVPSEVSISAEKAKSYEIACLGGKESTSASVLFIYGNEVMTTLAHEGKSEAMDLAMEARDRVANQVTSVHTASK